MPSIKSDKVVDTWATMVERGAGRDNWIIQKTEEFIKEANPPNVVFERTEVSTGIFGAKRDFLQVVHKGLRDYAMYIGARDFGRDLDCSWFVTLSPGFLKRQVSKYAYGNPQALSMSVDLFSQQDLAAYKFTVHHCFLKAIKQLMEELDQDFSMVNTRSKGFLEVW